MNKRKSKKKKRLKFNIVRFTISISVFIAIIFITVSLIKMLDVKKIINATRSNTKVLNSNDLKEEKGKEKEIINEPINKNDDPINTTLVEDILKAYPEKFQKILDNADKYDVQILYTQINRNVDGSISFKPYSFKVDKNKYFYPASSMKLSAAIVALDKLNNLKISGLDKYSPLEIKSGRPGQTAEKTDYSLNGGKPTIAQYIKKLLVASDNNSFNRLYEFVGQQTLNETLWKKGYTDILIRQRIADKTMTEENRYTNPFVFYNKDGKKIYEQPLVYNNKKYESLIPSQNTKKGIKHEKNGVIVDGPHDFSESNYASIETLQNLLKAVMFPEAIPENMRFNLTEDDLKYLRTYLSILPSDCTKPSYDYPDNYVKYFMFGNSTSDIPSNIKIYNKIGNATGYLIDNAYIVDSKNKVEFLLTAVILSNDDGVFATSHFKTTKIGMPFLTDLGRVIYNYELNGRTVKK